MCMAQFYTSFYTYIKKTIENFFETIADTCSVSHSIITLNKPLLGYVIDLFQVSFKIYLDDLQIFHQTSKRFNEKITQPIDFGKTSATDPS